MCSIDLKKKRVKEGDGSRVTFTEVCRSEAIGKIHRDELAQKLEMTLRCTSDLGADDTASALPRNGGGARRRGFDPCVWPIPIREPPLSNRTLKLDKQGSRGVSF